MPPKEKKDPAQKVEAHYDLNVKLEQEIASAKGKRKLIALRAQLKLNELKGKVTLHSGTSSDVKKIDQKLKNADSEGAKLVEELKGNWIPFAGVKVDLAALGKRRGWTYQNINLKGQSISYRVDTTKWGAAKLAKDGYARAVIEKRIAEMIGGEDLDNFFKYLYNLDDREYPPERRPKELDLLVREFVDKVNPRLVEGMSDFIEGLMGARIDEKSKLKDFRIEAVVNILTSAMAIGVAAGASVASYGTIAPVAGVTIAREIIKILTVMDHLAADCDSAAAIVNDQLDALYKAAGEKRKKLEEQDGMKGGKSQSLGIFNATIKTLADFIGVDRLPDIDNAEKWRGTHEVKITEFKNQISELVNTKDALVRTLSDYVPPKGTESKWKAILGRVDGLTDAVDSALDGVSKAEILQREFRYDILNLKKKNPAWSRVVSEVIVTAGNMALASVSGSLGTGEAVNGVDAFAEALAEFANTAGEKAQDAQG